MAQAVSVDRIEQLFYPEAVAVPRNHRPYNVRYYAANRARELERVKRRQAATTAFLRDLRRVPCADCGGRFEPFQMDFDHRDPTTKSFWLMSSRAQLKPRWRLLEEVAKCDVVCANCHSLRTRRQHRQRLAQRGLVGRSPRIREYRERWRYHADLLDQIRDVPCQDCGGRFPPCAMEFDHRDPATKVRSVTRMISNASIERILAEVDKCDVVCSNCHRTRTYRRRSTSFSERE